MVRHQQRTLWHCPSESKKQCKKCGREINARADNFTRHERGYVHHGLARGLTLFPYSNLQGEGLEESPERDQQESKEALGSFLSLQYLFTVQEARTLSRTTILRSILNFNQYERTRRIVCLLLASGLLLRPCAQRCLYFSGTFPPPHRYSHYPWS